MSYKTDFETLCLSPILCSEGKASSQLGYNSVPEENNVIRRYFLLFGPMALILGFSNQDVSQ